MSSKKKSNRAVGLHIRLEDSVTKVAQKALALKIPIFQCFLINQETCKWYLPTPVDQETFEQLRSSFGNLYLHGSYWINLASVFHREHVILDRELHWAERLGFTHLILHPGFPKGGSKKVQGIKAIARLLNKKLSEPSLVTIVLENGAHGGLCVGSDIRDFKELLSLLEHPEKVQFCIDTAHAYSYGYDLANGQAMQDFIGLIGDTIGFNQIALIHLNDTKEELKSRIDKHAMLGKGNIGIDQLRLFATDARLKDIPLIVELPRVTYEQEKELLETIQSWE